MSLSCSIHVDRGRFQLDVELSTEGPAFVALIGPSGSGKTTLLRAIAGLERTGSADIAFQGQVWQSKSQFVPPHKRPIGYVFQEASLFPHLTVKKNLEFGMRRASPGARQLRFEEVVGLLGVTPFLSQRPCGLSGGERQRVAIARALLTSPELLLLDEPLASLDVTSRAQIIPYLAAVRRRLSIPVLYVTHSPAEVIRLADEIVYLSDGRIAARGPINDVLTRPELPLCHFEDAGAAIDAAVSAHEPEYHLMKLSVGQAFFTVSRRELPVGALVRLHVRARDVSISTVPPATSGMQNVIPCRVLDVHEEPDPAHRLLRLDAEGCVLLARVTAKTLDQLKVRAGTKVFAHVKAVALAD